MPGLTAAAYRSKGPWGRRRPYGYRGISHPRSAARAAAEAPVSVTAQVATLTLSGVQPSVTLTAITVTAQTGTVLLTGVQPAVTLTALSVTAQTGTVVLSAVSSGPGIQYLGELGSWNSSTPDIFPIIVPTSHVVPLGDLVVVMGAVNNYLTGGGADTGIAVFGGAETFTVLTPAAIADPGAANEGVQGFIAYAVVEVEPVSTEGGIAVAFGTATLSSVSVHHFHGADTAAPVLASSYAVQNNQTGQSVSVGTGTAATTGGQMVLALVAVEGDDTDGFTQDTDTTRGTWTTLPRRSAGTGTSGVTLNQAYKYVTDEGAQTYDHATMLGTARDHAAAVLILNPAGTASPVTVTAQVATVSLSGVTSGGTLTALSVTAQAGALVLSGIQTAPALTALSVTAQPGTVLLTGVEGTPVVEGGAVTVTAQTAAISLSAIAGASNLTALSHGAQTGALILSGIPGSIAGGPVTVTAQTAALVLSGVSGAPAGGTLTVTAQPAGLLLTAQSSSVSTGAITVTAQTGVIVLTAVSAAGAVFVAAGDVPRITSHTPGRIRSETPGRIRSRQPDLVTSGV